MCRPVCGVEVKSLTTAMDGGSAGNAGAFSRKKRAFIPYSRQQRQRMDTPVFYTPPRHQWAQGRYYGLILCKPAFLDSGKVLSSKILGYSLTLCTSWPLP